MIKNLTPHAVVVELASGARVSFAPEAVPARVASRLVELQPLVHDATPVPFAETMFGEVTGLPAPQMCGYCGGSGVETDPLTGEHPVGCAFCAGTGCSTQYIVSALVIAACPERTDLVRPDTGPDAIRDEQGRIVAVRRLTR